MAKKSQNKKKQEESQDQDSNKPQVDPNQSQQKANQAVQKRFKKQKSIFQIYGNHISVGVVGALVLFVLLNPFLEQSRSNMVLDDDEIARHNQESYSFRIGHNEQFKNMTLDEAKQYLNTGFAPPQIQNLMKCQPSQSQALIPDYYNFRETFSNCSQLIYQQDKCASSYALAAASTVSDRICQQTGQQIVLSPQPLIACSEGWSVGCEGGYITSSLEYVKTKGLPETTCMSYQPNDNKTDCKLLETCPVHKITQQCVIDEQQNDIKQEIMENGPVISLMGAYIDIFSYKEGIYEVLSHIAPMRSNFAVKIIGWGTEPITQRQYWIIENFWGKSWGEDGTARIYDTSQVNKQILSNRVLVPVTKLN